MDVAQKINKTPVGDGMERQVQWWVSFVQEISHTLLRMFISNLIWFPHFNDDLGGNFNFRRNLTEGDSRTCPHDTDW